MASLTPLGRRLAQSALGIAAVLAAMAATSNPAAAADLDYPPAYKDEPYDRWGDRRETEYEERYRETHVRRHVECVPREVVRRRLHDEGWSDFDVPEPRGSYVVVDARRPNGRLFSLRIDRCSGEVVLARPLEPARRFARWSGRDQWRDWEGGHWRRPVGWERF